MSHGLAVRVRRVAALGCAVVLSLLGVVMPALSADAATPLVGTLRLVAASCSGSTVSGTYLRMILPSGGPTGPYLSNSDSTCRDQSYTPLAPGTDGGLISGSYQPQPNPPFDEKGNSLAHRITAATAFYGTAFATATNPVDPQTNFAVGAPQVTVAGSSLTADLRSFAVTWNNQYFNQGSPKPDGSYPGNTRPATGTYDASTHAFTLTWTSQVVGGPFDKFTGQWHLQGAFEPAARAVAAVPVAASGQRVAAGSYPTAGPPVATAPHGTRAVAAAGVQRKGAFPGAVVAGTSKQPNAQAVASVTSVTREHWHVAWWLVGLAIAIAVVGFGVLVALQRFARPGSPV